MSPWTIYWVMQADSILNVFVGFTILSGCVCFLSSLISGIAYGPEDSPEIGRLFLKSAISAFVCFVVFALACAFSPTTKTLCAMIAVPAIVNNETLQADASEIYKLGMERLKEELGAEKSLATGGGDGDK